MSRKRLLERIKVLESRVERERLRRLIALDPGDTAAAQSSDRAQTRADASFLNLVTREMEDFDVPGIKLLDIRGRFSARKRHTDNFVVMRLSRPIGEIRIEYDASRHVVRLERFGATRSHSFTRDQISAAKWRPDLTFHQGDLFSSIETSIPHVNTKREAARRAVQAIERLARVVALK